MTEHQLTDAQWCVLDLLMRAREKGVATLNRLELLHSPSLPQSACLQLTYAALIMPSDLVTWTGQHDFAITDAGVSIYRLRFGKEPQPIAAADAVICLPGPEHYRN